MQTVSVLKVREGRDPNSDIVMPNLPKGSIIFVVEKVEQPDKSIRGLIKLGDAASEALRWITTVKADGSSPLVPAKPSDVVPAEEKAEKFKPTKHTVVYENPSVLKVRKECDPKSELVSEGLKAGNLPKGTALYVIKREAQSDKSERGLIQLKDKEEPLGWITTVKSDGNANISPVKVKRRTPPPPPSRRPTTSASATRSRASSSTSSPRSS